MGSKKQEYRLTLAWLRAVGWRVDATRIGYPVARCPCGLHSRWIHRTPSNPYYYDELRRWVRRRSCWKEGVK